MLTKIRDYYNDDIKNWFIKKPSNINIERSIYDFTKNLDYKSFYNKKSIYTLEIYEENIKKLNNLYMLIDCYNKISSFVYDNKIIDFFKIVNEYIEILDFIRYFYNNILSVRLYLFRLIECVDNFKSIIIKVYNENKSLLTNIINNKKKVIMLIYKIVLILIQKQIKKIEI